MTVAGRTLTIPDLCLVVLVGPSGSGKSTFARRHFKPTEVISSDFCRGLVSDDENSQAATGDAFDVLQYVAGKRLARGLLTVVDATNVQPEARKPLVDLAREHDVLPVAVVLNLPEDVCHERNAGRPDRAFGPHVVRNQLAQLRRGLRGLQREGFRYVHVLGTPEEVEQVAIERQPLWNNQRAQTGPFDIIGDVHGCYDELAGLLEKLGYRVVPSGGMTPSPGTPGEGWGGGLQNAEAGAASRVDGDVFVGPAVPAGPVALAEPSRDSERTAGTAGPTNASPATPAALSGPLPDPPPAYRERGPEVIPPPGRKAVFLGDLVDRGPASPAVLRLVMSMVAAGHALCVPGNHDVKLLRKLRGKNVQVTHGLAETLQQMAAEPPEFHQAVERFIDGLVGHYVLDVGRLVVAHAGMKERYVGRASTRVREFALYGETTGETDAFGLPVRFDWAAEYRGPAHVIYGHTPVPEADWLNRTLNIDTGCVFGGKLTALRWPEKEVVSVPAKRTYAQSSKPFLPPDLPPAAALSAQQQHDDVLDLADVTGKRIVTTRLNHSVTIRAENATAALEVMSRFAADPKWLVYLPPTMSPTETSDRPGLLEHPQQAFDYFRGQGVGRVACQEKHMGSRAVAVVCRDEAVARSRFGVGGGSNGGIVYTRTGRRFFDDPVVEAELLDVVRRAMTADGFWDEFASDWFCLDCELMPWSAKAQDLLKNQYAAVGSAAAASSAESVAVLARAAARYGAAGGDALSAALDRHRDRLTRVNKYVDAYGRYCWPVRSVADLKLAPFHLLASEGRVHVDRDHAWHMRTLARLADAAPGTPLTATANRVVDVTVPDEVAAGVAWWEELTGRGGEGMVVKPLEFVVRGNRGLVQPAVKCRGPEYLRIIYGPEYDAPENLARLRRRGLAAKRSLALREFALGVEGLERFVRREPLRRAHECVFGVLALESEPVDPRL